VEPSKKIPVNATTPQERSQNSELTAAYEQLRCQVLGIPSSPPRGPGLAIFLERGMKAWIETYQQWAESTPVSRKAPGSAPSRLPAQNEVVALLTSLLLARTAQEER
jgi:hypothetical protein